MKRQIIHFAHANGFPAKTYSKLFSFLSADYEIGYIERHGHDPEFPVTKDWKSLTEELVAEIEARYHEPVIGIGHSFGGILHLLAAAEKPELYRSLVLLDAPVISRFSSLGLKILKQANLTGFFSPARETRERRNAWKDIDEAFEHFVKKEKFRGFDREVLRDYVVHGTVQGEKGVELFFRSDIEADIYETVPDHLPGLIGKIKIPVSYIGGTNSREARLAGLGFMRKFFPFNYYFVEGSHLFPLELPQKTAELILLAITANRTE